MKRKFFLSHVALLLMMAIPLRVLALNQVSYTATYDNSTKIGSKTLGGMTYATVYYEGLYNYGESGKPSLPVDIIKFSVPYNAINFNITVSSVTGETIELDYPLCPVQSSPTNITLPDNDAYSSRIFPSCVATYKGETYIAGENHIVSVAVTPFTYEHTTAGDYISMISSVSITLTYDLSSTLPVYPFVRRGANLREEGYEMAESIVVNPNDVRANALSHSPSLMGAPNYPYELFPNDSVENPFTYIIVTTPELIHSVRRLSALRMQKGINVKLLTVEDAMNDSMAVLYDPLMAPYMYHVYYDDAEKIRNNLRAYYIDHGCKYVLLAGSDVPYRTAGGGNTDRYYSELLGQWDGLVCSGGQLGVGRLLGHQSEEFENYTDKLFRYELNPGNGDYDYLRRELAIDFSGISSYDYTLSDDMQVEFEDSIDMSGGEIVELIRDNHYGLLFGQNEGFPSCLKISHYGVNPHYIWAIDSVKTAPGVTDNETGNGFNCLDNKHYPMIFASFYGKTMPFNINNSGIDMNCGESFTMGKDYGGPAYIGATGTVSYEKSMAYESYLLYYLQRLPLGEAMTMASCMFSAVPDDDIVCCYNLLGDPTIRKWTDIPERYANITISRTDNSVTINGINATNTIIGYHCNDGTTGLYTTSAPSVMLDSVSPNSTIMLYNQNHIPYIAPLVLQNVILDKSQYVIANDVTAGRTVDSGRTSGDVTVKSGSEYEIEASGKVRLSGGFKVEKGAYFTVQKATFK